MTIDADHQGTPPDLAGADPSPGAGAVDGRSARARRPRRHLGLLAGLAGVVVGSVLAGALVWSWRDGADRTEGPDAATEFVEAWERSRLGTFVVVSEFRRTTASGGVLEGEQEVVQRPPDHVVRQFGTASGRIDDKVVDCEPTSEGEPVCRLVEASLPSYEEQVADEVGRFDRYFFESTPLYLVTGDGDGCFALDLAQSLYPSPPYGRHARFCFDETTGALVETVIERDEATDEVRAVEIRTDVVDGDFSL